MEMEMVTVSNLFLHSITCIGWSHSPGPPKSALVLVCGHFIGPGLWTLTGPGLWTLMLVLETPVVLQWLAPRGDYQTGRTTVWELDSMVRPRIGDVR